MDCGDAGGEPAFSAEKTRSRSQKERNRERGYLWTQDIGYLRLVHGDDPER